jgi:hypothetical protein
MRVNEYPNFHFFVTLLKYYVLLVFIVEAPGSSETSVSTRIHRITSLHVHPYLSLRGTDHASIMLARAHACTYGITVTYLSELLMRITLLSSRSDPKSCSNAGTGRAENS